MTNADKFRAMTDEELAYALRCQPEQLPPDGENCTKYNCYLCTIDWLKREVFTTPQKKPLCDDCKHAIDGVVDDFATVFCSVRQGYFGQVTECKDYKDKRGGGEDG